MLSYQLFWSDFVSKYGRKGKSYILVSESEWLEEYSVSDVTTENSDLTFHAAVRPGGLNEFVVLMSLMSWAIEQSSA